MSAPNVPPRPPAPPVLGSARGRYRLDLDRAGDGAALEALDDPFLPLEDAGRTARVLLGRLAAPDGSAARALAVRLQRALPPGRPDAATNAQLDELWQRERDNLKALAGEAGPGAVDPGDDAFRSPPLFFCKTAAAFFHPPCPRCLGPLADCRDDARLRDAGLPEYSSSTSRFLHCPACAAPAVYYSAAPSPEDRPRAGVAVRRRQDLVRDWADAVRDPAGRDADAFPCPACPKRAECYPEGATPDRSIPAEARLVPVSFHEFHVVLQEPLPLRFDEACDLLGGADWPELRARAAAGGAGRERLLARLDEAFGRPFQWLYRGDASGRFALEVLLLKLALFVQAARELRSFHRLCRQPHLDLGPSAFRVELGPGGAGLPARWGFRARLARAGGPRRLFPSAAAPRPARDLWAPPPDADKAYVSPLVREMQPGQEELVRVSVRSMEAVDGRPVVRGTLQPDRARLERWQPGDVVRLAPSGSAGALDGVTLWGRLGERADRGFAFEAEPEAGAEVDVARKPGDFGAAAAFYPRFQAPCDAWGLGVLWLHALAANDRTDAFAVDDAAARVLRKLEVALQGKGPASLRRVTTEIEMLLEEERAAFGPSALLRRAEDRGRPGNAVPARLWADALLLAFRLLTRVPDFSFAVDHADADPARPEALLDAVLAEAETLHARVQVELFGRAQRDAEIHEACAGLLAELAGPGAP